MPCTHWDGLASRCPGPVGSPKSPSLYQIKYFRILFHKASPSPAIGLLRPRRISLSYTSPTLPTFQASPPHCRHLSQGTVCSREGKPSKQKKPPLIILLGYNLQCFLMLKSGQEIQTWLLWVFSLRYHLKGRELCIPARDARRLLSSFLQDINKSAAKKNLSLAVYILFLWPGHLFPAQLLPVGMYSQVLLSHFLYTWLSCLPRPLTPVWCCSQQKYGEKHPHLTLSSL